MTDEDKQEPKKPSGSRVREIEYQQHRDDRDWQAQCDLFTALAKAQGAMGAAGRDGKNPHFKSKFATLKSIQEAIREPLTENGLCFFHTMAQDVTDKSLTVICNIAHCKGGVIDCGMTSLLPDWKPQTVGSAETYLRRYTLLAALGIATEDDDGEGAQGRDSGQTRRPAPVKTQAPAAAAASPDHAGTMPEGWSIDNWQCYQSIREAFDDEELKPEVKNINKRNGVNQWGDFRTMDPAKVTTINGELAAAREAFGAM